MSEAALTTLSSSLPSAPKQQLTLQSHSEAASSSSTTFARRGAVLISFLTFLRPFPAAAFSLGISGPKDWLKEQKRKASKFLIAPIEASRRSLQAAHFLLSAGEAPSLESVDQLQQLVISASRDCVPSERNSFVAFQSQTGVEVCTFSLLVKNAASLLDTTNPVKLEAEAKLSDLVRSFSSLIGVAKNYDIQIASCKEQAENALMDTLLSLNKFEEAIQNCLI